MIERFHWCTASMYADRMVKRLALTGAEYDAVKTAVVWELLRLVSEVNTGVQVCFVYTEKYDFGGKDIYGGWLTTNNNFECWVRFIETLREELTTFKKSLGLVGFYTDTNMLRRNLSLGAFTLGAITEVYDTNYIVRNDQLARDFCIKGYTYRGSPTGLVYAQGDAIILPEAAEWHLVDPGLIDEPVSVIQLPLHEVDLL